MNYIGDWPDAYFYDPANMKPAMRDEFYKWHRQQQGKQFDYREELLSYCESDVDILRGACMAYRDMTMKEQGVDPFPVSLTIASACNYIFRRNYLKENTIGIIPTGLLPISFDLSNFQRSQFCLQEATLAEPATASSQ